MTASATCTLYRPQGRIITIIKRIFRVPIYHTRWQHMALYNNTNHTHRVLDEGMCRAVKNSLEIIIKQVRLEGGFESSCTLTSRTLCSKPRNASIRPTVQNIVWKTAEHYMSTVLHTGEKPVERCQSTSCPALCGAKRRTLSFY